MPKRRAEFALLFAMFGDLVGFGMLIPDVQLRAELLIPEGWPVGPLIGVALASTFVVQTLVSPRWGRAADRVGRKPIFLVCQTISALAMLSYGFAASFALIIASRVLAGLGAANVAVAQAMAADGVAEDQRTAVMGRMGAAISAGLIVGPALTALLARLDALWLLGFVGAAFSLTGALLVAVWVPARPPGERGPVDGPKAKVRTWALLRDVPALRPLFVISAVAWFSLAALEGTFGRLLHDLLGYGQAEFGVLFAWESILGVFVQAIALGWISTRVAALPLLRSSYLLQGLGLALTPSAALIAGVVHPMAALLAASTLYAIGSGAAGPTINTLASLIVPAERHGELFGLLQSARSLGFVIGPLLGGTLYDWQVASPYWIAGAVCVLAAFLTPRRLLPA